MSNDSENRHPNDDIEDFQSLGGLRILVVDDDADTCILITFILESYGVQVMTAASALDALEVIGQFEPNLLISDIAMPEVDGYSLMRKVRTLSPPLGGIPAIAVTAMDTQEGRDLALISGFQAYLAKPIEPDDLVIEIAKLITSYHSL
ncbi:response regulator [Brasilonema bromeliae]|uniref:Response regulator n=1 Tax=Brasilonema bromeliae SPC951 TaxID=385972 RepID=A0ABX1P1K8_9CYAN|nr:response regulator [Brasilonema bromeliae SPC951]